jgi:hypothetical protein
MLNNKKTLNNIFTSLKEGYTLKETEGITVYEDSKGRTFGYYKGTVGTLISKPHDLEHELTIPLKSDSDSEVSLKNRNLKNVISFLIIIAILLVGFYFKNQENNVALICFLLTPTLILLWTYFFIMRLFQSIKR